MIKSKKFKNPFCDFITCLDIVYIYLGGGVYKQHGERRGRSEEFAEDGHGRDRKEGCFRIIL